MSGYCHTHVECVWYVCHIEKKAVKIFDTHTLTLMFHKKKQKSCCFLTLFITIATLLPSRPVATPPSQITPASTISLRGVYPSKDKVIFVPAMPLSIAEAIGGRNFVPPPSSCPPRRPTTTTAVHLSSSQRRRSNSARPI